MDSKPPFHVRYKTLFGDLIEEQKTKEGVLEHERNPFVANSEYELPIIDLSHLSLNEFNRRACVREIGEAAKEWGFFQVVNHGISRDVLVRMQLEQVRLFRQPFYQKANDNVLNLSKGCYRWGNPTATSLIQFSWSEAFHVPLTHLSGLRDLDSFSSPIEDFAKKVSELAQRIAETLAENIGNEANFFSENCLPSSCYLRMNRYPPCPISSKVYGIVPHTDSDFLTVLYQDQLGGLQLVKDGKWVAVKPNPDALLVNIGDLFQAWSNGIYKSVEHRVITNRKAERCSTAYFLCPSYDTVIQSCNEPSTYRRFTFREYRHQIQEDVMSTGSKIGLPRFLA